MLAGNFFTFYFEKWLFTSLLSLKNKRIFKESENLEGYKKENLNDLNYITRPIN